MTIQKKDDIYKEIKQNLDRIIVLKNLFRFDGKAICKAFMLFKKIEEKEFERVYKYFKKIEKATLKQSYAFDNSHLEEFLFIGKNLYFSYKQELLHIAINHWKFKNELTEEMFRDKTEYAKYKQKLGIISKRRGLIELDTNPYLVKEIIELNDENYLKQLQKMETVKEKMIKSISNSFLTDDERKELQINELKSQLEGELNTVKTEKRLKI